jgi:hypothetical protein
VKFEYWQLFAVYLKTADEKRNLDGMPRLMDTDIIVKVTARNAKLDQANACLCSQFLICRIMHG